MAVFACITAHSMLQYAFLDGRLARVVGDPRRDAPAVAVILIAAGEALGLWLPALPIPWARMAARGWGALYLVAAATVAAIYHYFPFDLVVIDDRFMPDDGPPYLLAAFACLPIAGFGYLVGRMKSVRDELDADDRVAP